MKPHHLIRIALALTLTVAGCQAESHIRKADAWGLAIFEQAESWAAGPWFSRNSASPGEDHGRLEGDL